MIWEVKVGDCLSTLRTMEAESVQTCVTSPPYFGLRDYGVKGQIGLEPTPDEFVGRLVEVFREVRRVLRDDGTLWLNLGDSYFGGDGRNRNCVGTGVGGGRTKGREPMTMVGTRATKIDGFKPKDLIGIPWRVAFALQQPYYEGRIKNVCDRVWLAAMLDGEGCFYIHRRQAGQNAGGGYERKTDTFSPAFEVANTHKSIVDRCREITGVGSVICQEKDRRQPLWRWTVRSSEARSVAKEVYPHLVAKQQQCRILAGMPSSGPSAHAAWEAMKLLHAGSQTTVDFPAPGSCFQPGYYLRQDVIWSKPNPMPESVRDRCTKAHEYIFLLAKSERYYFDAEAVKEPSAQPERAGKIERTFGPSAPVGTMRNDTGREVLRTDTRNKRSVWTVTPKPFKGAHFATFPPDLIEPCVLAGAPEGGLVLDPFTGSGTTGMVAVKHGRRFVGCELNPEYAAMAEGRIQSAAAAGGLFCQNPR